MKKTKEVQTFINSLSTPCPDNLEAITFALCCLVDLVGKEKVKNIVNEYEEFEKFIKKKY